jgi:hypothetical protein
VFSLRATELYSCPRIYRSIVIAYSALTIAKVEEIVVGLLRISVIVVAAPVVEDKETAGIIVVPVVIVAAEDKEIAVITEDKEIAVMTEDREIARVVPAVKDTINMM